MKKSKTNYTISILKCTYTLLQIQNLSFLITEPILNHFTIAILFTHNVCPQIYLYHAEFGIMLEHVVHNNLVRTGVTKVIFRKISP